MSNSVTVTGTKTKVKKIVVGTPVRRVSAGSFNINNIGGVDTTGAGDGHVLVYNQATSNWVSTINLEKQNINGGSY